MITLFLLSACSNAPLFHSTAGDNTARVSFSSTMPGEPELTILIDCKEYRIANGLIDKRRPTAPANKIHHLPAGKTITLIYQKIAQGDPVDVPVNRGTQEQGYRIDMDKMMNPQLCAKQISFVPEKNQQYEISFGASTNNECLIFVKQLVDASTADNKRYKNVTAAAQPDCP